MTTSTALDLAALRSTLTGLADDATDLAADYEAEGAEVTAANLNGQHAGLLAAIAELDKLTADAG